MDAGRDIHAVECNSVCLVRRSSGVVRLNKFFLSSYLGRGGRGPLGGGPGQGGNWEAEPPTEGMLMVGGVDWWLFFGCWLLGWYRLLVRCR